MQRTRTSPARAIIATALLVVLGVASAGGCAGGDRVSASTAPGIPSLSIISGNHQSGRAGRELSQPLIVRAVDTRGRVLSGTTVVYVVTHGGGTLFAAGVLTNATGHAQNYWTLGATTGAPQTVEVRSVDPLTGRKQVHGTFTATATP